MTDPFSLQVSKIKPLFAYLKKQRENKKIAKNTEITATFILITFFLYFAIRPTFLTISSLLGDIKSKQLMKQELKKKINNVIKAQDLYSIAQEKYHLINFSLPDRPNFYDSAFQTQLTGEESGTQINKITFDLAGSNPPKKLDPNLTSYSLGLTIDGRFNDAMKIVNELLKNRRLINIESLNIGLPPENIASPGATANGGINTRFSAVFYYWPEIYGKK